MTANPIMNFERFLSANPYRLHTIDLYMQAYLEAFHREEKKQAGMFFTPLPVVRFIVDSIDTILKEFFPFTMDAGIADQRVIVLDPAAGTLTFALDVALKIVTHYQTKHSGANLDNILKTHF